MAQDTKVSEVAGRVIDKCGGVARVAEIVDSNESWVYRWTYPKKRGGTGGLVPRSAQEKILAAQVGVKPEDFFEPQAAE